MFSHLNEGNVIMFAMRHYSSPRCHGEEEFEEDYRRFKLMNRLLNRDLVNYRLVLNNIIILQNMFGVDASRVLLFYHTNSENWGSLKSFLIFLNYIDPLDMIEVVPDDDILQELEKL
jgi:hypothetical protein